MQYVFLEAQFSYDICYYVVLVRGDSYRCVVVATDELNRKIDLEQNFSGDVQDFITDSTNGMCPVTTVDYAIHLFLLEVGYGLEEIIPLLEQSFGYLSIM